MKILFLALNRINDISEQNIYNDLSKELIKSGHELIIVSPTEKRFNEKTELIIKENYQILKVKIGNLTKTNMLEKGISMITLERKIIHALKTHIALKGIDLAIYSTPPITFQKTITYFKKRKVNTYLLLKDIFPQNSVDLGILSKKGFKGLLYKYFRKKEIKLYKDSDYIGCMSMANAEYLKKMNPYIDSSKIELNPNSIIPIRNETPMLMRDALREKYGLPLNKKVFIYGGNLGKPQGIDFIIKCIRKNEMYFKSYILIVGYGTEYEKINEFFQKQNPNNARLIKQLPKEEYEMLVRASDAGLIFLDSRFTIPNFPSRLLSYMQAKIPVIAATDKNTDIGKIIENGQFGYWCESKDENEFIKLVDKLIEDDNFDILGENGWKYLNLVYSASESAKIICNHFVKKGDNNV